MSMVESVIGLLSMVRVYAMLPMRLVKHFSDPYAFAETRSFFLGFALGENHCLPGPAHIVLTTIGT